MVNGVCSIAARRFLSGVRRSSVGTRRLINKQEINTGAKCASFPYLCVLNFFLPKNHQADLKLSKA